MDEQAISFGPFRLLATQRLLLEGDKPVRLGSRAFDILAALVERGGEVVEKAELMARAWPKTFVEEANLKIQVSALRRALGDGQGDHRYIVTVPGRGYNFVAPVRLDEPSPTQPLPVTPRAKHNLPFAAMRMIGREEAVAALVSRLSRQRLMTIVGPGGVGKTTVALAVAERVIASYEDGVWLVDLAPLGDARLVPSVVATVLGLESRSENPLSGLVAALRDSRMLLVLDNCEPVIDAAASLAAAVLTGAPSVSIVATSREPLGVAGEHEYRLGPLSSSERSSELTAANAAAFPAVQLFVERVTAVVDDFALTDAKAPLVAEICRKLDGLPLAIEFAAPRVAVLGIDGLAARLDASLPSLGARRRTATPRHRTMRAVLDWSYSLLSEDEQLFVRALGIFAGGFTVEAAAVAIEATKAGPDVIDRLADLVVKSLVVADVSGANPRFRLLDTTRAYAIEKLDESGERERIARRHAEYYRDLFERAEGETAAQPPSEWLAQYAQEIDNLRAGLDWAFSPGGDASIGVALTAAAVPLWVQLSLVEECRGSAKHALGALGAGGTPDPRREMRLYAALGTSTALYTAVGASTADAHDLGGAFTKALDIAEALGDSEYRLRALHALCFYHARSGRYGAALQYAQNFHDLAMRGSDLDNRFVSDRMMGAIKSALGDLTGARHHLMGALTYCAVTDYARDAIRARDVIRFGTDLRAAVRVSLARVLWLQGLPDQALRTAEMSIEEARATSHALSLCYALALAACPIALWAGNLAAASHYADMLHNHSRKHSLPLWNAYGSLYQRLIRLKGGDDNPRLLEISLDEIGHPSFDLRFMTIVSQLVEALAQAGMVAEGLVVVNAAIEQSEQGWLTPELLRLKGESFVLQSTASAETAEALFRQALDEASRQGALSWELRAAMSLARLLRHQARPADAIACLQPIYDRFTEGFGTADLVVAKQLLHELCDGGFRSTPVK